jgi:hypothetical protein
MEKTTSPTVSDNTNPLEPFSWWSFKLVFAPHHWQCFLSLSSYSIYEHSLTFTRRAWSKFQPLGLLLRVSIFLKIWKQSPFLPCCPSFWMSRTDSPTQLSFSRTCWGFQVWICRLKILVPQSQDPGLYRSEFRTWGLKPGQRTLLIHLREWIHLDLVGRLTLSKDGNQEIQEIPMVGHPDMGTRNLKTPRI